MTRPLLPPLDPIEKYHWLIEGFEAHVEISKVLGNDDGSFDEMGVLGQKMLDWLKDMDPKDFTQEKYRAKLSKLRNELGAEGKDTSEIG